MKATEIKKILLEEWNDHRPHFEKFIKEFKKPPSTNPDLIILPMMVTELSSYPLVHYNTHSKKFDEIIYTRFFKNGNNRTYTIIL